MVAVEADLPVKIPIPKKDLKFKNHFPEGILKCRPGTEFSDDDDDESIAIKEGEISLVKDRNASCWEQLDNEAFGGEDCPFFSNLIWPNCSKLNFGLAADMHPNFFHEAGRRICIYRIFLIAHHPEWIDVSFLDENGSRSQKIPAFDASFRELDAAVWTISEFRKVMRRLTRQVSRMAFEDCSFRCDEQFYGVRELIDG